MSCSVDFKDLSICLSDGKILAQHLVLSVSHKEKIAIIGPNGCGKTTLLEMLAGLLPIPQGTLELFHHAIKKPSDFKPLRSLIGYLFQDSDNQFLAPVVEDDVAFSLLSKGITTQETALRVENMLEALGIGHLAKKIVYHLSGGEKKLVALAGVLICEPQLMLLDEPTNGLDEAMQWRLVETLRKIDKSMIIVSHHKEFIELVVDTIYELTPHGLNLIKGGYHHHDDHHHHHTHD